MKLSPKELKVLQHLRDRKYVSKIQEIHAILQTSEQETVNIIMRLYCSGLVDNEKNICVLTPKGLAALHRHERSRYLEKFNSLLRPDEAKMLVEAERDGHRTFYIG